MMPKKWIEPSLKLANLYFNVRIGMAIGNRRFFKLWRGNLGCMRQTKKIERVLVWAQESNPFFTYVLQRGKTKILTLARFKFLKSTFDTTLFSR